MFDAQTAVALFAAFLLGMVAGSGMEIIVSRRAVYGYDQRIEVFGSNGMLQSENQTQSHVRLFGKDTITTDPLKNFFIDRYAEAFVGEINVFLDAIEGKPANYPNLKDGREALALSMDALKSSKTGQAVASKPT